MVSHESFRSMGYVYSIFGTLGSIFRLISFGTSNGQQIQDYPLESSSSNYYGKVASSLVGLVVFLILFAGIYQKNMVLVKIYKYFLIISGILTQLVFVWYLVVEISSEEKSNSSTTIIIILSIGLAVFTGLFMLFLWIVNGVIGYIENEKRLKRTNVNGANPDDQKMTVTYEAV